MPSERVTVSGVLHASVVRKRRGSLLDELLIDAFLESGRITYDDRKFFYAPRYYLTDDDFLNSRGVPFRVLSFKGQPKKLSIGLRGHTVSAKATIDEWGNGIGAHLLRPEILSVSEERAEDHTCDSPHTCKAVS